MSFSSNNNMVPKVDNLWFLLSIFITIYFRLSGSCIRSQSKVVSGSLKVECFLPQGTLPESL